MPITYYSQDDIRDALNGLRKDLSEIHCQDKDGTRRLISQVAAQEVILLSVADTLHIDMDEQPDDEVQQLKQRIEKLERERACIPSEPYRISRTFVTSAVREEMRRSAMAARYGRGRLS